MTKLKVYLSGGFRTEWQDEIIDVFGSSLEFLDPRDHGLIEPEDYTKADTEMVKECDILLANMEDGNPAIGLALEVGLARGFGKHIIYVDGLEGTKNKNKKYFEIVKCSADQIVSTLGGAIQVLSNILRSSREQLREDMKKL